MAFDVWLDNFDLGLFQKEFQVASDSPMYDCYPVGVANIPFIKKHLPRNISINWNFNKYSYYVGAVEVGAVENQAQIKEARELLRKFK